jgi:uncharacterized lipoprotein YmbA
MRASHAVLSILIALGSGAACVSLKRTPEARFFVLRSLVEAPTEPAPATGTQGPARGLVGILPLHLPGYLDRSQVITWTGPGELRIDEFLRWAEPLDLGVTRVLGESLGTLLPSHRVIRAPWPSSAPLRCRVRLDLVKFGPQDNGEVQLTGRWALLPRQSERPLAVRSFSLRRGPLAPSADAALEVEAMSELLADLSREIAAAILALPAEEPEAAAERSDGRDDVRPARS